jgi:hypothetical protein
MNESYNVSNSANVEDCIELTELSTMCLGRNANKISTNCKFQA